MQGKLTAARAAALRDEYEAHIVRYAHSRCLRRGEGKRLQAKYGVSATTVWAVGNGRWHKRHYAALRPTTAAPLSAPTGR